MTVLLIKKRYFSGLETKGPLSEIKQGEDHGHDN